MSAWKCQRNQQSPHHSHPASSHLGSGTSRVHTPQKCPHRQRSLADTTPGNKDMQMRSVIVFHTLYYPSQLSTLTLFQPCLIRTQLAAAKSNDSFLLLGAECLVQGQLFVEGKERLSQQQFPSWSADLEVTTL